MGNSLWYNNSAGAKRIGKTSTSKGQGIWVGEQIAVKAAQLTTGALFGGIRLPKGAEVVGVVVASTDIDSNGAPAVLLSVGDSGNDSRIAASSNIGQVGGVNQALALAAVGYQYPTADDTLVQIKVKTQPATAADGTLYYAINYVTD